MLRIKPFRVLRPCGESYQQVASVPYDVVDRGEALALARGNPFSFLRVARPEIDLPENIDPYSPEVYQKAKANFEVMQQRGILIRDPRPMFYVYRLRRGSRCQHGIVACCHVKDYENNIIKKHEKTRLEKEEDRKRHIIATRAHSGPVFLVYRDESSVDAMIRGIEGQQPVYDFVASDGIAHTAWPAPATEPLVKAFAKVPAAYIADGHHRAAAAVGVARDLNQTRADGDAEFNWFLAVLFPASQLEILPYNRCAHDLAGLTAGDFLAAVGKCFVVEEDALSAPAQSGRISMYIGGRWFGLRRRSVPADLVAALDVSVLQAELLDPILGIKDPRADKRIDFIGGIHGTKELEQRVNSGRAAVAFSMYPATVSQLLAISDAGQIMPPKSTWFEPKLRDGLFIHTF